MFYREQIVFLLLSMLIMWMFFNFLQNQTVEPLQKPVYPQSYDAWAELNRSIRDAAWRNPMEGRKSDFPGGWN